MKKLLNEIPKVLDSIIEATSIPRGDQEQQLLTELAIALYTRAILSFGKARELAGMNKFEFGILLGHRGVPRHYEQNDLSEDIAYTRR